MPAAGVLAVPEYVSAVALQWLAISSDTHGTGRQVGDGPLVELIVAMPDDWTCHEAVGRLCCTVACVRLWRVLGGMTEENGLQPLKICTVVRGIVSYVAEIVTWRHVLR